MFSLIKSEQIRNQSGAPLAKQSKKHNSYLILSKFFTVSKLISPIFVTIHFKQFLTISPYFIQVANLTIDDVPNILLQQIVNTTKDTFDELMRLRLLFFKFPN